MKVVDFTKIRDLGTIIIKSQALHCRKSVCVPAFLLGCVEDHTYYKAEIQTRHDGLA